MLLLNPFPAEQLHPDPRNPRAMPGRAFKLLEVGFPLLGHGLVTKETIGELAANFNAVPVLDRVDAPVTLVASAADIDAPKRIGTVTRLEVRGDGSELWAITDIPIAEPLVERLSPTFTLPETSPASPAEALRLLARINLPGPLRDALVLARYIGDPEALARIARTADRLTGRPLAAGAAIWAKRAELLDMPKARAGWMRIVRIEMQVAAKLINAFWPRHEPYLAAAIASEEPVR